MTGYWGSLNGETTARMRADAIERLVVPMAKSRFGQLPALRSAMLVVAQYWNDEASDAVHAVLVYSPRQVPSWPHICPDDYDEHFDRAAPDAIDSSAAGHGPGRVIDRDYCDYCGPDEDDWLPWDDNGSAIAAFEGYCKEACHQGMELSEAYIPYAIIRRLDSPGSEQSETGQGDIAVSVDIVGRPIRPHLDLPEPKKRLQPIGTAGELLAEIYRAPHLDDARAVYADWLGERDDPRGELISLQLSPEQTPAMRARQAQLLDAHGRSWIGPIEPVIALSCAVFRRGFLAEAEVFVQTRKDASKYCKEPAWGTVEVLHFAVGSVQRAAPTMTALRRISRLRDNAVRRLCDASHTWPIRDLVCRIDEPAVLSALLASDRLPHLDRLELGGAAVRDLAPGPAPLAALPITTLALADLESEESERARAWLAALSTGPIRAFELVASGPGERPAGWHLRFERGSDGKLSALRGRLDNLGGDGRVPRVLELISSLPAQSLTSLELGGCYYSPLPDEEAQLHEAAKARHGIALPA